VGCFVALLSLISPRLALFAIFLFSDLLSRAYDSWVVPLLAFFVDLSSYAQSNRARTT
jgi:hypothetical protein